MFCAILLCRRPSHPTATREADTDPSLAQALHQSFDKTLDKTIDKTVCPLQAIDDAMFTGRRRFRHQKKLPRPPSPRRRTQRFHQTPDGWKSEFRVLDSVLGTRNWLAHVFDSELGTRASELVLSPV